MMRIAVIILVIASFGCNKTAPSEQREQGHQIDSAMPVPSQSKVDTTSLKETSKLYSNNRFKEVAIEKVEEGKYIVTGKGQIFESNFGWVVEDGHNELQAGNASTDAGAPEWGKFKFIIQVEKERANSTLHVILFEESAKDGSRQHELAIPLF